MREPFDTLLGHFADHWMLSSYLRGVTPDFEGILNDRRWFSLSNGEHTLVWVGLAFHNGDPTATVADLAGLDEMNQLRVARALLLGSGEPVG